MNKIYRQVWNHSLRQIVAVSELAKGAGGGAGAASAATPILHIAGLAFAVMLAMGTASAWAGDTNCPGGTSTGTNSLVCTNPGHGDSGHGNVAGLGYDLTVTGDNASLFGFGSTAGTNASVFGYNADASGTGSAAFGAHASAAGDNSVAMGNFASASDDDAVAIGYLASAAFSGVAMGDGARADTFAVAIGRGSNAGYAATAIGYNTAAMGSFSVALGNGASTSGMQNAVAIGNGAVASAAGDVALGAGSTTAATTTVGGATIGGNYYAFAGGTPSAALGVGGRQIQGVAAGQLSSTSTDAVNGSQLFATNTAVTALGMNVTNLGNSTAAGMGGTSSYDPSTGTLTTGLSVGGNTYSDVNSALDAINTTANAGWNLSANGGAAVNVAPGATVDVSAGPSGNLTVAQSGTDLTIDISQNPTFTSLTTTGDLNVGGLFTALGGISVAGGQLVDMGGNVITNVGAGVNPTDAVNLSQLDAAISGVQVHYYSVNDGGTQGGNYANDGATGLDALAAGVDASASGDDSVAIGFNAVAANDGGVALGSNSVTAAANPTASTTINGVTYNFAGTNPTSVVSVGDVGSERQITNVAAGQLSATSTDAVNGSQLYATNQAVTALGTQVTINTGDISNLQDQINNINQNGAGMFQVSSDRNNQPMPTPTGTNSAAGGAGASATGNDALAVGNDSSASGNGSTALGTGASATGDNSVAIGSGSVADEDDTVSVGSTGNERRITNVAAGVNPTDAVNVSQLQSSQAGGVHYDTNSDGSIDYESVTLNPGGSPTVVHNVANGSAANDAVNVGQLNAGIATAENWAQNYTDQRISQVSNRAEAGIASAIATANMPQPYAPNQSALSIGFGTFRGESGMSVGLSKISASGRYIIKASASSDTRGDFGGGVGAAIVW